MNTKETLLETIHVTGPIGAIIDRINFSQLEEYTTALFSAFVMNRGIDTVKYDLHYDVATPTDSFLSDVIEIGSVHLLQENNLLHDKNFIDALYVIIVSINIVVARFLQKKGITQAQSFRYVDADPQYLFLERAVEHVGFAAKNNRYIDNLVNSHLQQPVCRSLML